MTSESIPVYVNLLPDTRTGSGVNDVPGVNGVDELLLHAARVPLPRTAARRKALGM
jgi:hypothetical protein